MLIINWIRVSSLQSLFSQQVAKLYGANIGTDTHGLLKAKGQGLDPPECEKFIIKNANQF
jgi:hypothetical protein